MVNSKCQVFTPISHVNQMLDAIDYKGMKILKNYVLENSCGDGSILIEIVKRYIEAARNENYSTQEIKEELEEYILAFEIDKKVFNSCIDKLNKIVSKYGIREVEWNIYNKDYLKYNLKKKVEFIVGNPPYIMYQNLSSENRRFLKEAFSSCAKGKYDYCYAFIEKSLTDLSNSGRMSYIIPNSIFKNVFAKEIRNIMKTDLEEIYDYKESAIFGNDILISPAIIYLNKKKQGSSIKYYDVDNKQHLLIDKTNLGDKWIFSNDGNITNHKIYKRFGDFYKVSNSVATLLNESYLIRKTALLNETEDYIEVEGFRIEKGVLRSAASPRSYALRREEYIIFPYKYINDKLEKYEEKEFKLIYPGAYEYLLSCFEKLNARKADKSAKWFEYGRSQALQYLNNEKILMSSVVTNEVKVYRLDRNTIPYSGFYIIPLAERSLSEAEDILKSEKFSLYLSARGINANGKSLRFSVKDILNFPMDE